MISFAETFKNNHWKIMFGGISTIVVVISSLFAIDARYAHAATVEKDKVQTARVIKETALSLRRQMLEDKVFELDIKKAQLSGKVDPVDIALRERYMRHIEEIDNTIGK